MGKLPKSTITQLASAGDANSGAAITTTVATMNTDNIHQTASSQYVESCNFTPSPRGNDNMIQTACSQHVESCDVKPSPRGNDNMNQTACSQHVESRNATPSPMSTTERLRRTKAESKERHRPIKSPRLMKSHILQLPSIPDRSHTPSTPGPHPASACMQEMNRSSANPASAPPRTTLERDTPATMLAGLDKRPVPKAALCQADNIRNVILNSSSPLALHPTSEGQLERACAQMMQINSWRYSLRTVLQDNASNWRYWTDWCRTWRTPPVRAYYHLAASQEDRLMENWLWTSALPWILSRMPPGPGRDFPLPSFAASVLRGVRRIHVTLEYEPPPSVVINNCLKALMNFYVEEHGPEALKPRRTVPVPFNVIEQSAMLTRTSGIQLLVPAQVSTTSREPNIKLRALFMSQ